MCHGQESYIPNLCKYSKPKHELRRIVSTGNKKVIGELEEGGEKGREWERA